MTIQVSLQMEITFANSIKTKCETKTNKIHGQRNKF